MNWDLFWDQFGMFLSTHWMTLSLVGVGVAVFVVLVSSKWHMPLPQSNVLEKSSNQFLVAPTGVNAGDPIPVTGGQVLMDKKDAKPQVLAAVILGALIFLVVGLAWFCLPKTDAQLRAQAQRLGEQLIQERDKTRKAVEQTTQLSTELTQVKQQLAQAQTAAQATPAGGTPAAPVGTVVAPPVAPVIGLPAVAPTVAAQLVQMWREMINNATILDRQKGTQFRAHEDRTKGEFKFTTSRRSSSPSMKKVNGWLILRTPSRKKGSSVLPR